MIPDFLFQCERRKLFTVRFINLFCVVLFAAFLSLTDFSGANATNLHENSETDSLKSALKKPLSSKDRIATLYALGKGYLDKSDLNIALKTDYELLDLISKHGTKLDSANCFRLIGLVYMRMAWYDKSLENLMQSQQLFGEAGDTNMRAKALMNVGTVHDNLGNLPMSLSYYTKSLDFFKLVKNESGIADCELNMAILLVKHKKYNEAREKLISAASIYEKTGNKANLAAAYINLGLIYKKLHDYPLAIDYHNRAYDILKKAEDDYFICYYHLNMGEILLEVKKIDEAYDHLSKAETIAKTLDSKDLLALAYEYLSDYNAARKNYAEAYNYLTKSKIVSDSILNATTTEKVNQIQYHYEIAKREADNQTLVKQNLNKELQISKKNLFLYILSAVLLFIAVLAVFLINQNRIKRKANLQLEEQNVLIQSQKDELVKLNASKDKFLSILAHDIRNPLSSIFGISDLLVSDYYKLTEEEKRVFTQDIHTLSVNLFEIINTLLTWSTSQSGMITYRPVTFSLFKLCEKSINTLQTVAKQKDIKLLSNADESIEVLADENMIYSVVHNLLNNAIKFSHPGSEIHISARILDGFAEVSVSDTGIGLSPENQLKLFQYDQHFLSKGTAGESGTGLGLILCNDFVKKNGGTIRVESELQNGSTFIFTIPLATS